MFFEQLEKLCKTNNTTPTALITSMGMGSSNVTRWKKGTMPNSEIVLKLSDYFNVTTDYLLTGKEAGTKAVPSYLNEDQVLQSYRLLDRQGKDVVSAVLSTYLSQNEKEEISVINSNLPDNVSCVEFGEDLPKDSRGIAVFFQPSAAGTGTFLDSDDYDEVDVPLTSINAHASFGVRVSGDSMEPEFENKDIVYVRQQRDLENGEIGIFILNGDAYIKKLSNNGKSISLLSLNPTYPPIEVKETDEIRVVGKVIGKFAD